MFEDLTEWLEWGDYLLRLLVAAILGGLFGLDRELGGHWAGLRTHMIVTLGAATFAILGQEVADNDPAAQARIIQGVATGIGFLGAGTILKLDTEREIRGLTTAGTIWLAAALGTTVGIGNFRLSTCVTAVALLVLVLLRPLERYVVHRNKNRGGEKMPR